MAVHCLIEKDVEQIRSLLSTAFSWHSTPQGHKYWSEVHSNLYKLLMPRCPHCGHEVKKEV